jgi:hypothetical protein
MKNGNGKSNNPGKIGREELLRISSDMIEEILERVKGKRFRPREGDTVKLQYLRILVSAIQAHNAVLKDEQLEQVLARLDALEKARETPQRIRERE